MTDTLSFMAGDVLLGTIPACDALGNLDRRLWSEALCCPQCGAVWGRIKSSDPRATWLFTSRACRSCAPLYWNNHEAGQFTSPPAVAGGISFTFTPTWPEPLLRWEVTSLLVVHEARTAAQAEFNRRYPT